MSNFKVAILFFAALAAGVCLRSAPLPADEAAGVGALGQVSTDEAPAKGSAVAIPQDQENTEGKNVIHGRVFTVPVGDERYSRYGQVHGIFTKDDHIFAEFTTDERGEFTLTDVPAGDWTIMLEQERDEVFGSAEATISYDVFHEETLTLFLNECGLARFPNEFDPSKPIAENDVKYWQYVDCRNVGARSSHAVNEGSASSAYSNVYDPYGGGFPYYDPYGGGLYGAGGGLYGAGGGLFGAGGGLGLLGLAGGITGMVMGITNGGGLPRPVSRF